MKCLKIFTIMVLRTASQRTQRRCEEGAEGACTSPMFPRVQLSIRCKAQCGISFCALVSAGTQGCGWSPSAPSCAEQSRLTCERDTSKAAQHLEMKCRRSARRSRCSKALRWPICSTGKGELAAATNCSPQGKSFTEEPSEDFLLFDLKV